MIGVTIGVGEPFCKMALLSARCLKEQTGLDSVILNSDMFSQSGLKHPAALRLKMFDLVDADHIIYFDCDWLCLGKWNPGEFADSSNVIACHDFVLEADWLGGEYDLEALTSRRHDDPRFVKFSGGQPKEDYISEIQRFNGIRLHYSRWINTGMFIVTRRHHEEWLNTAEQIYRKENGHHHEFFEQPALLLALERLSINVDYLPRKYNFLTCGQKNLPSSIIGLHLKLKYDFTFARRITTEPAEHFSVDWLRGMFLRSP